MLEHSIYLLRLLFISSIRRRDFFKQEKIGNTDGINCSFKKGRTETF